MRAKLTLTIDHSVIQNARKYAYARGQSLSELVENYLITLADNSGRKNSYELTPIVKSLMGSFKAPQKTNYKKVLLENKLKRHGKCLY